MRRTCADQLSDAGSRAPSALGSEFQVNTYTTNAQLYPSVAAAASGDFVVAWASVGQDGNQNGVFARRFSSAGAALASEFQVNTYTNNQVHYPSVAARASGEFVIAWQSYIQDGQSWGVFARSFSSAGAAQAAEFQVNTYTVEQPVASPGGAPGVWQLRRRVDELRPGRLGVRRLRPARHELWHRPRQ